MMKIEADHNQSRPALTHKLIDIHFNKTRHCPVSGREKPDKNSKCKSQESSKGQRKENF